MTDTPRPTDPAPSTVEYVGPFEETRVLIDGRQVPFLTAYMRPGGIVSVTLDHRLGLDLEVAIADRVVEFIADAIAIGMGYTCHPRTGMDEPVLRPPFTRWHELGAIPTEEHGHE